MPLTIILATSSFSLLSDFIMFYEVHSRSSLLYQQISYLFQILFVQFSIVEDEGKKVKKSQYMDESCCA